MKLTVPALAFLALAIGCSGDDGGGPSNEVVENACLAACDSSQTMCPAADPSLCTTACPAYAVLIDAGSACETAYLAYQACRETATFTCTGDYAFIAGTECDAAEATCDATCDSPCL